MSVVPDELVDLVLRVLSEIERAQQEGADSDGCQFCGWLELGKHHADCELREALEGLRAAHPAGRCTEPVGEDEECE